MSDEVKKEEQEDFEAHLKKSAQDEPTDEAENDVEAHVRASSPRVDSPKHD
jgi:hypothetical protein